MSSFSNTELDRVAIETSYDMISYSELERRSDLVAQKLSFSMEGDVVLFLKPDTRFYVALLACKKAGHPVVPLDVAQSPILLRDQFNRLTVGCMITTSDMSSTFDDFRQDQEVPILLLDQAVLEHSITSKIETNTSFDSVLHRIFTSGSSDHQSLVSIQLDAMLHDAHTTSERYGFKSGMSIASLGRPTSSLGINGFWRSYYSQTTLLSFDFTKESMHEAWQRIADNQVQVLQGQTSLTLRVFKSLPEGAENRSIKHLILGGEPLETTQLAVMIQFLPCLEIVTYNYSSTETMLVACYTSNPTQLLNMQKIPVGFAATNKTVHIVDEDGNPVKKGEIGHIVVQSSYIASHIDNPQGRRRLWQHDENSGERMFNTGDLGRINSTGLLEHYGRSDREIKIRGKRINLAKIENELLKVIGINEAVITYINKPNELLQLVAFVIYDADKPSEALIFSHLAQSLPLSHIPNQLVPISELPRLLNGKPDHHSIKAMAESLLLGSKVQFVDISDTLNFIQGTLIHIWSHVLQSEISNTESSLFSLGVDSLVLYQAIARINELFSVSFDIAWVLDHPSIVDQERYLNMLLADKLPYNACSTQDDIRSMLGWS